LGEEKGGSTRQRQPRGWLALLFLLLVIVVVLTRAGQNPTSTEKERGRRTHSEPPKEWCCRRFSLHPLFLFYTWRSMEERKGARAVFSSKSDPLVIVL
jgi:hypothetical protein